METLDPSYDHRTKSDDRLFVDSLSSRSIRRTSSFPLLSMSSGDGDDDDTISLCDKSTLMVKECDGNLITSANSTGALPTGLKPKPRYGSHLFLGSMHHLPHVGSLMSIANQQLPDLEQEDASAPETQPKRKWLQTLQQTSLQFGLDFCFSIEGALVIPILLQLGLPDNLYGIAWFLAPLLGFLMAPLIGSGSDQCYSPLGQRRPFIIFLGVLVIIGTGLYLNSADLGILISESNAAAWGIAVTVIGMVLADFGADGCDSPFKAYLMDNSNLKDIRRAFSMRSFLGGIGGGIGFICVGINWEETFIGQALGSQLRVICLINIVVIVITLILTLTSVKEVPLQRSLPSQKRAKYAPCKNKDRSERTIPGGASANHRKTKRRLSRLLGIFKRFMMCERKERTLETTVQSGRENEKSSSSESKDGNGDASQTKDGSVPNRKADGFPTNGGKAAASSKSKDDTRRQFIPKKKGAKASGKKAKKQEASTITGGCCVVKVSLNDDAKDLLKHAIKVNGGQCAMPDAMSRTDNCASTVVSISSTNPSVEVNCGMDDDGGESDDDDDNKNDQEVSRLQLLLSSLYMPRELRLLCFANFFTWAGLIVALCFYTDFVAQAVYHGDPSAPEGSEEYRLYEEGVQMGSWGLCIYSFSSSVVSLAMPFLQNHLSQKCLYVGSQLIFAAGCAATALMTSQVYVVLVLCVTHGLMLVIVMTIPHNILAIYHKSEKYKNPEKGLPRRLGTDLACLDCQLFLSQIIVSALIGPLIQLTGSHLTIMVLASIFSLIAAVSAGVLVTYEVQEP